MLDLTRVMRARPDLRSASSRIWGAKVHTRSSCTHEPRQERRSTSPGRAMARTSRPCTHATSARITRSSEVAGRHSVDAGLQDAW